MAARAGDARLQAPVAAPLLFSIEGEALTSIEFFGEGGRSMLLRFGGARLEVLSKAIVRGPAGEVRSEAEGWRRALTSLVSARVHRVALERGRELVLEFDGGSALAVPLGPDACGGPESAVFFDEHWTYEPY